MIEIAFGGDPRSKGRHRTALRLSRADLSRITSGMLRGRIDEARKIILGAITQHADAATREFEMYIRSRARLAMGTNRAMEGAVTCRIRFSIRIPRSWPAAKRQQAAAGMIRPVSVPDLDNLTKSVLDGMNGIAYRDDSQITDLILTKRYSHRPGVVATVAEVDLMNGREVA